MRHPVIAIALDAAEHSLLTRWMGEGHLPNLRRLLAAGRSGRLENFGMYMAELPWTTFLTGCVPERTGYWSPLLYDPAGYRMRERGAYDFAGQKPFYALGPDWKVCVFDMPQARPDPAVNGLQALAWGAHSPQTGTESLPRGLMAELVARHGPHPALNDDHLEPWEAGRASWLMRAMLTGIHRRTEICLDLLARDRWDLFLTCYGEPHTVGHGLWHRSDPAHPLYDPPKPGEPDPLLAIHAAIDAGIGRIAAAAPPDARIAVFAAHGMRGNNLDMPSMFFLPELLYRHAFGRPAFAAGRPGDPLPDPHSLLGQRHWAAEVYARREDWNPLRRFVRKAAGFRYSGRLEGLIGPGEGPGHPTGFDGLRFMPATWYGPCWPRMPAFALPSFADGYVRINLKGRDARGLVDPAAYDRVCAELATLIRGMVDARTGRPLAASIVRTRANPLDPDPNLPDADLVVEWAEGLADTVDHPRLGRIGPVPHRRSGGHTAEGFVVAAGAGLEPGRLADGYGIDLAPTLLELMGAPPPNHLDGVSLFRRRPGDPVPVPLATALAA